MWKKLWEWIKRPHGWQLVIFYLFAALCVAGSIIFSIIGSDKEYGFVAYIFYALAAVTFFYAVYTIVISISGLKGRVTAFLKKFKFSGRLIEEYGFRTIAFAVVSFVISMGNAVINGAIGIAYVSSWYLALGVYYFLLASMRGGVLLFHHKKRKKYILNETETQIKIREIKSYRVCGIMLVLFPMALSAVIAETVIRDRTFVHSGMMIYASAAYTFYKVTMSVINFIKARKSDEMTVRAIRYINLADAIVSLLALQTAMFHEFSPEYSFGSANAIMGAVVCAITLFIGAAMIVNGSIKIKRLRKEELAPQTE